ncbi:MAG: polysaccharide deacetylase family protein [Salinivirgaceae bacterium]|jgi:hypothetical protein|nr:polysaccharide deacetylase family protein [Salinivirgaceae bacterium]
MIVYCEHITPRLSYVLSFVLKAQLGLEYEITDNPDYFESSTQYKINYSQGSIHNAFQILPMGLLEESSITDAKPVVDRNFEIPIIFKQTEGEIHFDFFAAVFWYISRYEEYQPYAADNHKRFPAMASFSYANELLNRPIVDEWVCLFKEKLLKYFPEISYKKCEFKAITTIDVDSPWCYKNKGLVRNIAGLLRDILRANVSFVYLRLGVLFKLFPDPWFKFNWINTLYKNTKTELFYFIHVGNYGKYDKTVNWKSEAFSSFVKNDISGAGIGLHPSYVASFDKGIFKKEQNRLAKILDGNIVHSRQHFLVFSMSQYYTDLIEMGIEHDYSMGFADKPGFRAGTSNSFPFFDLKNNKETSLIIHPFVVMDRTLKSYENQSIDLAMNTIKDLIQKVKSVNGTFISLWHNESLSNTFEWKGWQKVFIEMTKYLS